jgi:hypothetical protein
MKPISWFAIGPTSALYLAINAVRPASFFTRRSTMRLSASTVARTTSRVRLSSVNLISVTRRPNDEPLVTSRELPFGSGMSQT